MLANYLKISIAVLLRRKFLTFVNLFGTALTLTILMVAYAVVESRMSPDGAQRGQRHVLAISQLRLSTALAGGGTANWGGGVGLPFYERYIGPLETPDRTSFFTRLMPGVSYIDGRRIDSRLRYTDAAYWEILSFRVLDGRTIAPDDVETGRSVAVINDAMAQTFFPAGEPVGRTFVVNSQPLEVIGVVANEPETSILAYADTWIPLTAATASREWTSWVGNGTAMLYVENPALREAMREEYARRVDAFEGYAQGSFVYQTATSTARTGFEIFAAQATGRIRAEVLQQAGGIGLAGSGVGGVVAEFLAMAVVGGFLLMALPAINMANLNVGRIMERASEIGLRKAVGASKRALVGQFLFENVVLAAVGGVLALAITAPILSWLNASVYAYGALKLNVPIFVAGLSFIVVFAVISGLYPAWKMARLEPAAALRGQRHA